jgi:hypothetical protein
MSKNSTKLGNPVFSVERNIVGLDGKAVYGPNGKLLKEKVHMADGHFADGTQQSLYFPPGHPQDGLFKGMANILDEWGFTDVQNLRAECPNFQCCPGVERCCCQRLLFNQPDFVAVKSMLEMKCKEHGYDVLFLPKFHCELNFIEQCWGFAKRKYQQLPPSSSEAQLEWNVISALQSVPLQVMQR